MSVRFAIALFTTVTSPNPADWIFRRSTEAPIADEPMPASQANTMFLIGPCAAAPASESPPPTSCDEIEDFLPFICSMDAVAAARSSSPLSLAARRITAAMRKVTVAAASTARVTPR